MRALGVFLSVGILSFWILVLNATSINFTESSRRLEIHATVDQDIAPDREPRLNEKASLSNPFTSCDIFRDNCGQITPSPSSVFIADGAYNSVDGTIFFADVASGQPSVFQLDPATCTIMPGTHYWLHFIYHIRGIGFDEERYQIWIGEWFDSVLMQCDAAPPYEVISSQLTYLSIASIAIDQVHDYLFVGTNAYPDMVHVFDISGGSLGPELGSWPVPWQSASDGFDMAGMAFDDDSGQLIIVNQYGGGNIPSVREVFDFDISSGLSPAGYCDLDHTGFAWGIGLIEDGDTAPGSFESYYPDIASFAPPFPIDHYGTPPATIACSPDSAIVEPADTLALGLTVYNTNSMELTPPLQVSIIAELNNGIEVQVLPPIPRRGFQLHGGSAVTVTFGIFIPASIPVGFTCMLRTPLILQETGVTMDEDTCFVEVGETGLVAYDGERMSRKDWRTARRRSEELSGEDAPFTELEGVVIELPY